MRKHNPFIFLLLPIIIGVITMFIPESDSPFTEIIIGSWILYLIGIIVLSVWDTKRKTKGYRFAASCGFFLSSLYCLFPAIKAFPSNTFVAVIIYGSWLLVFLFYFIGPRILHLLKIEKYKRLIISVYFLSIILFNLILGLGGGNERTASWGIDPLFIQLFEESNGWKLISFIMSFGFSHLFLFPLYLKPLMDVNSSNHKNKKGNYRT